MAKKRKRGRKKSKPQTSQPPQVREESPVVYEKRKNIFSSIYDLSIGRIRVVALLLVVIGLVLIVLGGLSLFKAIKGQIDKNKEQETVGEVGEIDDGIQTENEVAGEEDGGEGGNEGTSLEEEKPDVQEATEEAKKARVASSNQSVYTSRWVATDYKSGDIKAGNYEVQRGDTLWEISEAVYGSGFDWRKILEANSGSVGFLPNGSQALIVPGQVLTIPAAGSQV